MSAERLRGLPLAPEEAALLDVLIQQKDARESVPIRNRTLVRRFEKYAFAPGLDDAGYPFPIPDRSEDANADTDAAG